MVLCFKVSCGVICVQHRVEDQRLGSELDRVSQRFRHYNRVEDRRKLSEREEKEEKDSKEKKKEEENEKEQKGKDNGKEEEKKEEKKKEEEKEEEKKEEEEKEEEQKEEEEGHSSDLHPLTDNPPSDRLKDAEDESGEASPSETRRTLSEETDNSEKELVQQ